MHQPLWLALNSPLDTCQGDLEPGACSLKTSGTLTHSQNFHLITSWYKTPNVILLHPWVTYFWSISILFWGVTNIFFLQHSGSFSWINQLWYNWNSKVQVVDSSFEEIISPVLLSDRAHEWCGEPSLRNNSSDPKVELNIMTNGLSNG